MTQHSARVTILGNPGLDTLVFLPVADPDLRVDGHFTRNVDTAGGAAAYTARGMARLGHRTRLLGAIGDDVAGRYLREVLAADGVDLECVFCDPVGSMRSVNLIHPDGRRTFFFDGASHMTQTPPDWAVSRALDGCDLLFSSLPNWGRRVLPEARSRGIRVAVDLQDVRDPQDGYRADFIAAADHLFASAAHVGDPVAAAQDWFSWGPARTVVFGMGSRGALLVERTDGPALVHFQPPPPLDLPIVDTTGAGDGLATGFLDGLMFGGLPAGQALHRAQVLARITASQVGGDHLGDRDRLRSLGW